MARATSLPILTLKVPEQQFSCQGCGDCCRNLTVQLRPADIKKLDEQNWYAKLGTLPYHEFRGTTYLKQDDESDSACIFLRPDGNCRIHAEFGYTNKPLACQMFPFTLMPNPADKSIQLGLSYSCPSVIENQGIPVNEHLNDVKRIARGVPELTQFEKRIRPIEITQGHPASPDELRIINDSLDNWLTRFDLSLHDRLCGISVLAQTLGHAVDQGFTDVDLKTVLDSAVEQLLEQLPDLEPAPPSTRQLKQLRQFVYAHIEDPKISEVQERGIRAKAFSQLKINNAFAKGRGAIPIDFGPKWPTNLTFEMAENIAPANSNQDRPAIDFLLSRYLRARILGGRAFGPGYYKFSIVQGLQTLSLMLAATGWLARLHAGANERTALTLPDVQAALQRTDRHAGRAPWLGGTAEKTRQKYFNKDNANIRLTHAFTMTNDE